MSTLDPLAVTVWSSVLDEVTRVWTDLESDYKSVGLATVVTVAVVGLGVQIPW